MASLDSLLGQDTGYFVPHFGGDVLGRTIPINQPEAAWLLAGKVMVGGADPFMKFGALLLVAHFMLLIARVRTRQPGCGIDIDAERKVRN